ncbi:MAG: helix-turn-helix transcriptional regulator [Clostridia bacterium]|nr:helix-turn-helix transcriptional regulator [Clostridia bacterium]
MKDIKDFDNFTANPITSFKNAGYYKHRTGWVFTQQAEHAVFFCVESGQMKVRTKDCNCICNAGDVVFIKNCERVTFSNVGDGDLSYYFVSFFCKNDFDFQINTVTKDANVLGLFKDISNAHRSGAHLSKIKVAELFLRLIYMLCSLKLQKSKDYTDNYKLLSTIEYININYYKKITPEYLSELSGYSPAHLRRLFVKNFGMPPMEYILNKKIDMAKEILLDAPEKTTQEIADLVGFCSASYFCKTFKKCVGISPLEFKRKNSYV